MKKNIICIFTILLFANLSSGQNLITAFINKGKVFVLFDNGISKEIVSQGENAVLGFSLTKNFVVYARLQQKSKAKEQEGEGNYDQLSIHCFNLISNRDKTLFTTCLDGAGGTEPDYANSSIYPFDNLCGLELAILSIDGERLYFQTSAWTTCPVIHYFSLKDNKLVFYKAGWLENVTNKGVEVTITGIEFKNNQGNVESNGRYTQYCLFDTNGNLIKELSAKEF